MSSSDNPPVTAWALDELEMPHVFEAPLARNDIHSDDQDLASPQERARIEAAAYAHGRADGERLARGEFAPRIQSAAMALDAALEVVEVHQARWTASAEENLAVLAVAVARQLIAREVEVDATIVTNLVQRALVQFPLDQTIMVRLHPDDVETCTALLRPIDGIRSHDIRWTADSHIHRGGCMVEGRERIIDGRVDTALERVYRAIGNVQV